MTYKHDPAQHTDDVLIDLQCQGEVEGWLKRHPVMQVGASAHFAAWIVSCQRDRAARWYMKDYAHLIRPARRAE